MKVIARCPDCGAKEDVTNVLYFQKGVTGEKIDVGCGECGCSKLVVI